MQTEILSILLRLGIIVHIDKQGEIAIPDNYMRAIDPIKSFYSHRDCGALCQIWVFERHLQSEMEFWFNTLSISEDSVNRLFFD